LYPAYYVICINYFSNAISSRLLLVLIIYSNMLDAFRLIKLILLIVFLMNWLDLSYYSLSGLFFIYFLMFISRLYCKLLGNKAIIFLFGYYFLYQSIIDAAKIDFPVPVLWYTSNPLFLEFKTYSLIIY
jgi:hypothetical protein